MKQEDMPIRVVGCPDCYAGRALVTIVDLLGFSVAALSEWNKPGCPPWKWLHRFREQAADLDRRMKIQVDSQADFLEFRPKVLFVADTVVFATALDTPFAKPVHFIAAYMAHLAQLGLLFGSALQSGFLLRGGMEIGHVRWSGSEILGPAQIVAHQIESKCCKSPRICLGPTLLDTVACNANCSDTCDHHAIVGVLDFCRVGDDGLIELAPRVFLKDCRMEANEVVSHLSEAVRFHQNEQRVREKYEWLLSAIRQEIPINREFPRPEIERVVKARDLICEKLGLVLNPHASPSTSPTGGG